MVRPQFRVRWPSPPPRVRPAATSRGDDPARNRETVGVGRMIDIAPPAPALDANGVVFRIDPDAPHQGKIDDKTVIDGTESPGIVAAAADGEGDTVVTSVVDAGLNVGGVDALCDGRRTFVDHRVEDGSGLVIFSRRRHQQFAAEICCKIFVCHGSPLFVEEDGLPEPSRQVRKTGTPSGNGCSACLQTLD